MANQPRIILIDADADGKLAVQKAMIKAPFIMVGGVGYGEDALSLASDLKPRAIIIGIREPIADALVTLEGVARACPTTPIIAYSQLRDYKSVRRAMLAGAWDYLAAPVDETKLIASLEQALASPPPDKSRLRGTIITVFGPKGGIGKSTVAVNLAAALAQIGASPVVVDLDCTFGDVARIMKVPADTNLVSLTQAVDTLDGDFLSAHLFAHRSGISVVPAPAEPSDSGNATPETLNKLLRLLYTGYDFVIIDSPANLSPAVTLALGQSDVIFLLSGLDPISVQATNVFLKTIVSASAINGNIKLAVNQITPSSPLSPADVTKELQQPVAWSLPYDLEVTHQDEQGLPVVLSRPKAKISQSFADMAALLVRLQLPPSSQPPTVDSSHGVFPKAFA